MSAEHTYIAIDLKSFYASVECAERHLDPLTTNLVVADASRTEKTICLAVSPSLKAYGIPGRARLFEVVEKVRGINASRLASAPGRCFSSSSFDAAALAQDPSLELSYITAPPRMNRYMEYSSRIYDIYLRYFSPDDIHVYSIDECFIDVTQYLSLYGMDARELTMTVIREVLYETGITATGGIGTNLYLCKVAMDIVAKHVPADKDGVRIAALTEQSYRELLWDHTPLTDFWRIGHGYEKKLSSIGIHTMGDIARLSIENEEILYKMFGVNAELLIDHAWGWEPTTIDLIKEYRPESRSLSVGQVLQCPYTFEKAGIIVKEMAETLSLQLTEKGLTTDQIVLMIGYDIQNLTDSQLAAAYHGPVSVDRYGRRKPKHAGGSVNLGCRTSVTRVISEKVFGLYKEISDPTLLIRRLNLSASHVLPEENKKAEPQYEQLSLFTDYEALEKERAAKEARLAKEMQLQKALLSIKDRFGKNAVLRGLDFEDGATTAERNRQVGGHKA